MQEPIPATSINGTVSMYNSMVGQLNNLQFSQANMAGLSGSQDFVVPHGHYVYSPSSSQPSSSPQHHMTMASPAGVSQGTVQGAGGGSPQHCPQISRTQQVSSPTHHVQSPQQFASQTDPHLTTQLSPQHSNNNIPDIILTGD